MAATAAAAAAMQALKASGVIVHVEPQEILRVVSQQSGALVVRSTFGILSTHYSYITSYKGLAFYAKCYGSKSGGGRHSAARYFAA